MSFSFQSLKQEYADLYSKAEFDGRFDTKIKNQVNKIKNNQDRYKVVQEETGVPWYVVGLIHNMEVSLRFNGHLHNGDPLSGRTVNVPKNRPKSGSPPFTWEESAIDAMKERIQGSWKNISTWSIPSILWRGENYNGWGYRKYREPVKTPYLWSGTTIYKKGKYISDGSWDSNAVSQQIGMAALLKEMENQGILNENSNFVNSKDYGLGCVDSSGGTNRNILGNVESTSDAITQALGILGSDIEKEYVFNGLLEVSSIPEILELKPQDEFKISGFDDDLDDDKWICDEICFYFGNTLQADLDGYRGDKESHSNVDLFQHSDAEESNPSQTQLKNKGVFKNKPTENIPKLIKEAAIANKGKSSANGPGGGNVACAWVINKFILPDAGVDPIGKVQVNVDSCEKDLQQNRGRKVNKQESVGGDIAIMGSGGANAHIGICLDKGCNQCISNSSSKAAFVWITSLSTYNSYYGGKSRIYRVIS